MKSQLKEKAVSLAYTRLENAEITITMREIADIVARAVDEALEAQASSLTEHKKEKVSEPKSTVEALEDMILSAHVNWMVIESMEIDSSSFDNILTDISRGVSGAQPLNLDEFTINMHGSSVLIKRSSKEQSYGV
jgi:hypothetical protein